MRNLLKLIFICLLAGLIGTPAQAQTTGTISGKLIEATSKEAVGFASVGLFSAKDSTLIMAGNSSETGNFKLDKIPFANYYLKVSLVGYSPKIVSNLNVTAAKPALELGVITVASSAKKLSEVEIVAQKNLVEYGLDKQVLNVAKDISSTGGTAADALKNAPSVAVDIDGNVSVRGSSNVTVLVDGKNSGQNAQTILSQTPASAIEKIEVITNPSAKYDAEGMGGIINIILKKERKVGLNGNAAVNLGTADNYNTSLNLNYAYKKFNFFAGYDFQQNARPSSYHLSSIRSGNYLEQNQTSRRVGQMHIPKIGFDYQISDKQTLTISTKSFMNGQTEKETVFNLLQQPGKPDFTYNQHGKLDNKIQATDLSVSYRKTFVQKGRELTFSTVYSSINGHFNRYITQENVVGGQNPESQELHRNFLQDFNGHPFFAQLDYVHPVGEKGKFETGAKQSQRVLTSNYNTQQYKPSEEIFNIDSLSNNFGFGEYVSAAYGNYSNAWKKITYQVGLRAEQTNIRFSDHDRNERYKNSYLNLFPSIFLSHEINENRKVQLNYSRRVNRPNYEALNPFRNYSDPFNVWSGNPKLMPEFIDSYEASYLHFWQTGSVTNAFFYRNVHNLIQQVRFVDTINTAVAYNSYVNLDDAVSYGLEISGTQALAKWWKLSGNVSAFNYKVLGKPLGVEANSNKFSWLGRLNSNFNLPKNLSVQVSVNYRSPQALAQGTRAAIYNTDIALKKDVLNKKASVSLRVSDVFNTLRWNTSIRGEDLTYDLNTKRLTRIVFLGFAYRFGKEQDKRRRDTGNTLEGMF